ncbi:MAG: hypothetical protein IPM31_11245 [Anaerolineae bacterium]|nr:hypothetical protein [Anaerolineae bacterium]MBL8104002.1 hypothetical protein [Anaerolineales bacterium]MCC7190767.1 hypothetical protein [Anaerolineales bacterium]
MSKVTSQINRFIQILIIAVFGLAGYVVSINVKTEGWGFYLWIVWGLLSGIGFALGYADKKYQIFLWVIFGACLGLLSAVIGRQKQDLITMPLIFVFMGTLIGYQTYESPKKVKIGAVIGAIFLGGLALAGAGIILGEIELKDSPLAIATGLLLGAWLGAYTASKF